jgi:hypothetical protein
MMKVWRRGKAGYNPGPASRLHLLPSQGIRLTQMRTPISPRSAVARPRVVVAVLQLLMLLLCAAVFCEARAAEVGEWRRVSSEHFVVLSNAGDAEAREAAARLEELRAIFSRLPATEDGFDVSVPVTVILFQTAGDYEFFKPAYRGDLRRDVAGYFQSSPDINYITLSLDVGGGRKVASVLFHEYVHARQANLRGRARLVKRGAGAVLQRVRVVAGQAAREPGPSTPLSPRISGAWRARAARNAPLG